MPLGVYVWKIAWNVEMPFPSKWISMEKLEILIRESIVLIAHLLELIILEACIKMIQEWQWVCAKYVIENIKVDTESTKINVEDVTV